MYTGLGHTEVKTETEITLDKKWLKITSETTTIEIKRLTEKGRGDEVGYWCFYHWENRIQNSTWWKEGKTLNTDWRK